MKVRRDNPAFTLVELLIVLAVIVLLVSILTPSLRMAREQTASSICQSNLAHLAGVVHISSAENCARVPSASEWVGFVVNRGALNILRCPKDSRSITPDTLNVSGGIDDLRIKHDHSDGHPYWFSVPEALAGDVLTNAGNEVVVTTISDTEKELWMNGMGSIRIKFGATKITISIGDKPIRNDAADAGGSFQYLYQGDKLLMQLRGKSPSNTIPVGTSVEIPWAPLGISYGMNALVATTCPPRLDQLMLVEYKTSLVDLGKDGNFTQDFDDPNKGLDLRHFGKANMSTVSGAVSSMTRAELDPDLNSSLWQP